MKKNHIQLLVEEDNRNGRSGCLLTNLTRIQVRCLCHDKSSKGVCFSAIKLGVPFDPVMTPYRCFSSYDSADSIYYA